MITSHNHLFPAFSISYLLVLILLQSPATLSGQNIYSSPPETIDASKRYVFYLHGAIVQQQGPKAVSERFGPYEYQNILEALSGKKYVVISEVRPKAAKIDSYAEKVASEIKLLLENGVPANKITVVGASMGAYMAVQCAYSLKNSKINFAVLGMCSESATKYFSNRQDALCGNFFSIYEKSDGPGSCKDLLGDSSCKQGFKELALNIGNSHGFLYKPYAEWMEPLSAWINTW